jgi:hypothetical protein
MRCDPEVSSSRAPRAQRVVSEERVQHEQHEGELVALGEDPRGEQADGAPSERASDGNTQVEQRRALGRRAR